MHCLWCNQLEVVAEKVGVRSGDVVGVGADPRLREVG